MSCKDLSELAGQIMELRQAEVPMSKLMEAMGGEPALEEIVMIAYGKPSFQGKEFIERQVAEYKNEVYRHCFKAKSFRLIKTALCIAPQSISRMELAIRFYSDVYPQNYSS